MASPDGVDALAYALASMSKYNHIGYANNQGKTSLSSLISKQKEINRMHCPTDIREEMRHLQRCGCNRCYDKYKSLQYEYDRSERYAYYSSPIQAPMLKLSDYQIPITEEKKMNIPAIAEPKNYAVKLLVDQLKAQQGSLTLKKNSIDSDKSMIKVYQNYLKTKNTEKLTLENKIKELSVALKKLGHKEA